MCENNYNIILCGSESLSYIYFVLLRVGISLPTIEVRFEHLNVEAEAYVGSRALPTFFNFCANIVEVSTCKYK